MSTHNKKERLFRRRIAELMQGLPSLKLPEAREKEFIDGFLRDQNERVKFVDRLSVWQIPAFRATVAASAFAALVIGFNFLFMPLYPSVLGVKGTVKIYRSGNNEWIFADRPGIKLGKNDVLKTFGDGQADLVVAGLFHIRLKSDTEIKLCRSISRAASGNIDYVLNKGRVLANYNKNRRVGKELNIQTPQAEASALGTDFMVESMPAMNKTMVGVLDGVVKVESLGVSVGAVMPVLVKTGEKTVVFQGMSPSAPTRLLEDEIIMMEELYGIGAKPRVALLISTGPTRTRELLVMRSLYTKSDRSSILPDKLEPIARNMEAAIKERSKEKHLENIKALEDLVKNYPNPKYDIQFLLFIGAYYGYVGEYQRSVEVFERVVKEYPRSSMASIAQCAIGIIYEENLKDSQAAMAAYQKVLTDYPHSPEVEEASSGITRINK